MKLYLDREWNRFVDVEVVMETEAGITYVILGTRSTFTVPKTSVIVATRLQSWVAKQPNTAWINNHAVEGKPSSPFRQGKIVRKG